MPRSTRPAVYGPEYEQLLLTAFKESFNKPYRFQLQSTAIVSALVKKNYAYWNALRKEASRPDLVGMCDKLSMRPEGDFIVFFRRADAWDAVALRAAMGLEKGFSDLGLQSQTVPMSASATDAALGKLQEIRARKDAMTVEEKLLGTATKK